MVRILIQIKWFCICLISGTSSKFQLNWEKKFRQNICKLQVISNVEKSFHEEYFIFSVPDSKEDTNLPPAVSFSDMIRNFINNVTAIFTGQNTPKNALRLSPTLRLRQSNKNPIIVRIPIVNVQVSRIFFFYFSNSSTKSFK